MRYIVTSVFVLFLIGCSTTVPVVAKFPVMPDTLMTKCTDLEKLKDDAKLSEIAKTVTTNYTAYHECAIKHDATVEWYQIQKKLFEEIK